MLTFLITVLVFSLVVCAMAVGVIAGRQPIKGSCGGIGALGIDQSCEICGGDPNRCDEESASGSGSSDQAQFYAADERR